jgi:hypothetical protein
LKANNDLIPISDFITESERNLMVATAVYEQYEPARDNLVAAFFKRLESDLAARLQNWQFEYSPPFFIDRYGAFGAFKPTWKNRYQIRIEAVDSGNRMVYGVWRHEDLLKGVPRSADLLATVRRKLPSATSRAWYEAEIRMTSPATDWRKPNVMWRMQSDESFRKEIATLMIELIDLTGKQVDHLCKHFQSK